VKNLLPFLVLLLAFSCHRPASTEQFVRGSGPYTFAVDMSDSTCTYDFDLYTRIDAREYPARMQLDMAWKAPNDSVFTETVYLPVDGGSSFFSHEAYAPYRAEVVPAWHGAWTVTVSVPNPPEGLRGMGLVTRYQSLWDTEN